MIVQQFIASEFVQRFVRFKGDATFRPVLVCVDPRSCELSEFMGKVARKVNSGPERTLGCRGATSGSVWGGVPVLGELWRIGLEDCKGVTVTSGGQNSAEMIEMGNGRMKG